MDICNSASNAHQNDSDLTLIRPTLMLDDDIPSVINWSTTSDDSQNQISVYNDYCYTRFEYDSLRKILNSYAEDLENESNNQFDCSRQLITRLMDFIRPFFSSDKEKIAEIDKLRGKISNLHDRNHCKQNEKDQSLRNEIIKMENFVIQSTDENRISSHILFEELFNLQQETRKLENLLETQLNKINELNQIISYQNEPIEIFSSLPPELINSNKKKCCLCDFEYPTTHTENEIRNHVEDCLSSMTFESINIPDECKQLACPYCDKELLNNGDVNDLHHMAICCSLLNN